MPVLTLWLAFGVLLAAGPAAASPSFNLVIGSGAVTRLAVGETLHLVAYLPGVFRGTENPLAPVPLAWTVEPEGFAVITEGGLLTARKAGPVRVHVRARDPKDAVVGEPGSLDLVIVKTVPGGRLPRISGGPPLERFDLDWDSGYDKTRGLYLAVEALRWRAGATTVAPPEGPLPWTLKIVPERSQFDDEDLFRCCTSLEMQKQMQSKVTSAVLTIRAWKDGVASGRFVLKTSRGVDLDVVFDAPLADRDGALAKASEPKDPAPPR